MANWSNRGAFRMFLLLGKIKKMWGFGTMWDHLAPFGTIWDHLGPFGTIWDLKVLTQFGTGFKGIKSTGGISLTSKGQLIL